MTTGFYLFETAVLFSAAFVIMRIAEPWVDRLVERFRAPKPAQHPSQERFMAALDALSKEAARMDWSLVQKLRDATEKAQSSWKTVDTFRGPVGGCVIKTCQFQTGASGHPLPLVYVTIEHQGSGQSFRARMDLAKGIFLEAHGDLEIATGEKTANQDLVLAISDAIRDKLARDQKGEV